MTAAPRLAARFAAARAQKRAALIVYLTADDPDGETSLRLMKAAADAGADVIEVGVPWSDPSADGKAIQAAMHRALAKGGGLRHSLALCAELRAACPDVGLVLFGYANPIFVTGTDAFASRARAAGADGVLCVDYPPDADPALRASLAREGLDYVPLLAPTSTDARIDAALAAAGSFVYYVSMTGTTGTALADLQG
ncbi:MAG TPA: tryptophan synthase subunit alpha, partial [Polyangia bacterium]|nr:tryptophan synthase subunit alpha [Polyangia bacterium]